MYELMYVIQCMNCKHLCVITTVLVVFDSAGIQKWAVGLVCIANTMIW